MAVGLAAVVALLAAWWLAAHTPATHVTGASSRLSYVLSQPWVTLRYLGAFVAPVGLSADNDWPLVTAGAMPACGWGCWSWRAWSGSAYGRTVAARRADRVRAGVVPRGAAADGADTAGRGGQRPPHVLSVRRTGTGSRVGRLAPETRAEASALRRWAVPLLVAVLVAESIGVFARNRVWRSDESLWHDVTVKSPTNGRGLMNYGLTLMAHGDYPGAIGYFERALVFTPDYPLLHVNLGIAYGGAKRAAEAERAFQRALTLAPADWRTHYYLARWLGDNGRPAEAVSAAARAVELNAADAGSSALLARLPAASVVRPPMGPPTVTSKRRWHRSAGQFREALTSAQSALWLRPDYAAAWNNAAAAHIAMGEYDQGSSLPKRRCARPRVADCPQQVAYAVEQKARRAAAGNPPRG